MKKDKFPDKLYVTCDGDSTDGFYPLAYEDIPDREEDRIAVYEKVSEAKIVVTTELVEVSRGRTSKK